VYSPASVPPGCSSITVEISFHPARYPMQPDEALARAYQGLQAVGILHGRHAVRVEQVREIPYGHIIYNNQTEASLRQIRQFLHAHRIYPCGKYGEWKDLLMPQAILSGREAARAFIREGIGEPVF
jgi:protoporphyrinogen oxidase